jgi:hypothetical protein
MKEALKKIIRRFENRTFERRSFLTAFMRFSLGIFVYLISYALSAQLYPCNSERQEMVFSVDNQSAISGYDRSGTNQTWLFTDLKAPYSRKLQLEKTKTHPYSYLFPSSTEYWKDVENDYFLNNSGEIIGELLPVTGSGEPYYRDYLKPIKACLNNGLATMQTSSVVEIPTRPGDAYPERLFIATNITVASSSAGTLHLPDASYSVQRWDITKSHDIEMQEYSRAGWIPAQLIISSELNDLFTDQREFWFVETKSKALIAKVVESGSKRSVFYSSKEKQLDITSDQKNRQLFLYPSTSFGDIRLDFVKFDPGEYLFEVVNVIGKKIWSRNFMIRGDESHNIDLSFLPKGPYIYVLYDQNKNAITTKRLAIIKP